ncbi:MAG: AMP-binding protein [Myxococcales bacterium]|nr:AMP-binding protein [Myxococcales bacterium]MCB9648480.1 AMP-binding protein [Deltaproteobacteria bacterium]
MTAPGPDERLNIADRLRAQAQARPHARAVVVPQGYDPGGRRAYAHYTFRQLDRIIDRYASGLAALGVGRGTRTLLMVTPSLEFFGLTFALQRMGAVPVLIDPAMGKTNVLAAISEVEPEAFVAIPKGHVVRTLFKGAFKSVKVNVTVGRRLFWGGHTLEDVVARGQDSFSAEPTVSKDLAAILFTSGSTGAPKGVLYTHGIFDAQVRIFEDDFKIVPGEVDLSAFPLFSLFSAALGVTVLVPDMDATKPAFVDPVKMVEHFDDQGVTYAFGSPAFWKRVAEHCLPRGIVLDSLQRVLMAGAPAPVDLLEKLVKIIPEEADVYTPYGATESLPITLPSARRLLPGKARRTGEGKGTCVGEPMPHTRIKIIEISDEPIAALADAKEVPPGEIGEIVVSSPVTTQGYFRRPSDDARSKLDDGGLKWHRMGDVGWMDEDGDLWFCGRKSHRITTPTGPMFTVCCEAIFNQHPRVYRSALVGVGAQGNQTPVLAVECHPEQRPKDAADRAQLTKELLALGAASALTRSIQKILFHDAFPVDARHNAKIRREDLAVWAAKQGGAA